MVIQILVAQAHSKQPLPQQLFQEILSNPFDVEMKSIVLGFAGLVEPMVETIDRRGLKDVETFARTLRRATHF